MKAAIIVEKKSFAVCLDKSLACCDSARNMLALTKRRVDVELVVDDRNCVGGGRRLESQGLWKELQNPLNKQTKTYRKK